MLLKGQYHESKVSFWPTGGLLRLETLAPGNKCNPGYELSVPC
jgi:hypothetical protein